MKMRLINADNLDCTNLPKKLYPHMQAILDFIDSQPTLEERKVGKWEEVWESQRDEYTGEYDEWREHKCSVCGFQEFDADRFKYCPNCGAEMRGNE